MGSRVQPYATASASVHAEPDILWRSRGAGALSAPGELPVVKLRTAIVSLVSVGLLWWFLRHANLSDVWAEVHAADPARLVLGFVLVAATFWARAVRWQMLLEPLGHTRFRSTFRATIIGFAALGVLPARAGDVLRPYLLARQEGHSVTAAFATIVVSPANRPIAGPNQTGACAAASSGFFQRRHRCRTSIIAIIAPISRAAP